MRSRFNIGDRVRFRDDYDGYFRAHRGQTMTVRVTLPKDEATDGPGVCVDEIAEIHLIRDVHLEPAP